MSRPSARQVAKHAVWLGLARAAFGAPAVAAPDTVVRGLRLSGDRRDGSHRFFAGFFGIRELLLGGYLLAARRDLGRLEPVVAFGALADLSDSALIARELARRDRPPLGAVLLLSSGLAGSAASIALWLEVRKSVAGSAAQG